jgi:hypothetical protein
MIKKTFPQTSLSITSIDLYIDLPRVNIANTSNCHDLQGNEKVPKSDGALAHKVKGLKPPNYF